MTQIPPEQRMWQQVVLLAVADATKPICKHEPKEASQNRDAAHSWLIRAGHDFKRACSLAGMDPDFVHDSYRNGRVNHALLKSAVPE